MISRACGNPVNSWYNKTIAVLVFGKHGDLFTFDTLPSGKLLASGEQNGMLPTDKGNNCILANLQNLDLTLLISALLTILCS